MTTQSTLEPTCFVIMPFEQKDLFSNAIYPGVRAAGFACERADKNQGLVHKEIVEKIFDADVVVADLSEANANVYYELGIAHTIADKTVLVRAKGGAPLPFDIAPYRVYEYDRTDPSQLRRELEERLRGMRTGALQLADSNPVRQFGPQGRFVVPYEKDRNEHALQALLALGSPTLVAPSVFLSGGRLTERASDTTVIDALKEHVHKVLRVSPDSVTVASPEYDLIVVGSPRQNAAAEQIQRHFALPFGYVSARATGDAASRDVSPTVGPAERTLRIVTSYGEELSASKDHGIEGAGTDYGLIVLGTLPGRKRLVWLSGIHGRGTQGVYHCLAKYADQLLAAREKDAQAPNTVITQLVRVKYQQDTNEYDLAGIDGELIGDPVVATRAEARRAARGVLFDLGDVVMKFDRDRTYRSIAHLQHADYREVRRRIQEAERKEHAIERYELGRIPGDQFLEWLTSVCGGTPQLTERLAEFWSDIFWPNYEMFEVLRYLKEQRIKLGLVSNTNAMHIEHIRKDYPEIMELFDTHSLSFEVHAAKPDARLFSDAIDKMHGLGVKASDLLYVDDLKRHVGAARKLGVPAFIYRSHSHFVWWLRSEGIFIPTVLEEPPEVVGV